MDGTRSKGLAYFLSQLPPRYNSLSNGIKVLPNGNQVADGKLMAWVYKLKSIGHEIPAVAFSRDLAMFARQQDGNYTISKTAATLNYWLQYEHHDLPLEITRMSFASYNAPLTEDGTLPVRLFGEKLNLKRLKEKKIPWLICYGTYDDLVEKKTALAPLDFIDAEVTPFPKGQVAIATSWSSPESACALHTRFGEGNYRGPVLFHKDLDAVLAPVASQASLSGERSRTTPAHATGRVAQQMPVDEYPTRPPKPIHMDQVEKGTAGNVKSMPVKNTVQMAKAAKAKNATVVKVDQSYKPGR